MAVVELALLPVRPGHEGAFEAAVAEARPLIEVSPGFLSLEIRRPLAAGQPYLLLAQWRSVADHKEGFRRSERYERWRALLHAFYDSVPAVSYFGEPL